MNRQKLTILLLLALILFPAAMRFTGHPWNFTAVGALALFVGAHFRNRFFAFSIPIVAMFLSDVAMGWERNDWSYAFHDLLPFVYACYLVNVALGFGLRGYWTRMTRPAEGNTQPRRASWAQKMVAVPFASLLGAVIFFIVTNFAVWAMFPTYPHTLVGLIDCYAAGLPYFRSTLAGDLFFAAVFFGGYELLRQRVPAFEESRLLYAE